MGGERYDKMEKALKEKEDSDDFVRGSFNAPRGRAAFEPGPLYKDSGGGGNGNRFGTAVGANQAGTDTHLWLWLRGSENSG